MPDILHEVIIESPPDQVFKALTEQQGLASWWTTHAKAEPTVGSNAEFRFMGGQFVIKMQVTKLDPGRSVDWITQQGAPDWASTRVTWELTPAENGTKLLFGHRDFASAEGSLPNTSYNWAVYLTSLKDYLEKGLVG